MKKLGKFALLAALAATTAVASADQITFKNGDKLTGKITTMEGGKMKIATAVAGEVVVDMKDIVTFSTDAPIDIRTADGKAVSVQATSAEADQIKAGEEVIAFTNIAKINPPAEVWTGAVVVAGQIVRGNTRTDDLAINIDAALRRNNASVNDRTSLLAAYNLGIENKITTTDNWLAGGKYDKFFDPKFYGYGIMKVEHDRIADLDFRLSPGVGVGYQWVESPDMNFNTEAGVSYIYEEYGSGGSEDNISARLAYHFDKKLAEKLSFFHNFEIVPAFEDPHDFNLTTDAGIRADLTKSFFAQFRVEWKHDATPAPGADKNDYRYLLGIGWRF